MSRLGFLYFVGVNDRLISRLWNFCELWLLVVGGVGILGRCWRVEYEGGVVELVDGVVDGECGKDEFWWLELEFWVCSLGDVCCDDCRLFMCLLCINFLKWMWRLCVYFLLYCDFDEELGMLEGVFWFVMVVGLWKRWWWCGMVLWFWLMMGDEIVR